jgi:glycerophosphoryl diester phosphodiesterase
MKSEKNDMALVIEIQKDIMQRAQNSGRKLEIFIGLPTEDKIKHFLAHPEWETTLSLCELELADVEFTKADFWGPRWTLGYNSAGVEQMHAEGKRVITWTMDEGEFIKDYIQNADFDGMVTNYPTLVAFHHWTR